MLSITPFNFRFIPAKEPSATIRLLVLVHGRTGNLKLLQWYAKRFDIPELSYLAIEAPFPEQREGQTEPGFSWYLKGRERIDESRKGLIKMVEELKSQGLEEKNIYWMGFSQGAAMSLDMAIRGPFQMGGFICVSGLCVQFETYPVAFGPFARLQRILITHGSRDEIISLSDAEKTYEVLKSAEIPFEYRVFDKPHSFHMREEVPYLEAKLKNWIRQ